MSKTKEDYIKSLKCNPEKTIYYADIYIKELEDQLTCIIDTFTYKYIELLKEEKKDTIFIISKVINNLLDYRDSEGLYCFDEWSPVILELLNLNKRLKNDTDNT